MASLAQGIVGGDMAWPLVVTGILLGIAMIMFKVKSPMLVAIGMYLPIASRRRFSSAAWFAGSPIRVRGARAVQRTAARAHGECRECWWLPA